MLVEPQMDSQERERHLGRFYGALAKLAEDVGGPRRLADCNGRLSWPLRGVYFFFEDGEDRSNSGEGSRVVRVGTHALKSGSGTSLWTRLSQHRGVAKSRSGNHRGSIFRLIVGSALVTRDDGECATWGVGSSAPRSTRQQETWLEQRVSEAIGSMRVLWLDVADPPGPESLRGFIERNSIALLSNYRKPAVDAPSEGWLGRSSDRERVRESGLWNSNHVDEACDPTFIDALERYLHSGSDR